MIGMSLINTVIFIFFCIKVLMNANCFGTQVISHPGFKLFRTEMDVTDQKALRREWTRQPIFDI